MTENVPASPPSRESYFRNRKALDEASRKAKEIEEQERIVFENFAVLFYGEEPPGRQERVSPENLKKVREALGGYTIHELTELYPKIRTLFLSRSETSKFEELSSRSTAAFLAVYMGTVAVGIFLASEFVLHLGANFIYVVYSEVFSVGVLGIMYGIKGVINHVRKKKEQQ
ncbi:MAG: hypothetical protein QXV17_04310 [Candidatus Micrarchaeaceae archaeon]